MTEQLHFSLSCIGEGNGNPLQCSCLENPRDGGARWAAVYEVTQSWTRLKWLSRSSSHFFLYIKYPLYIFSSCVLKSLFYPSFIWYEYFVQSFFFPDFFYVTILLNLLQYCYWVFFLLLFWPQSIQDLISLTRGRTHKPTLPSLEGKALITRPPYPQNSLTELMVSWLEQRHESQIFTLVICGSFVAQPYRCKD